jgi:hypothetical protein
MKPGLQPAIPGSHSSGTSRTWATPSAFGSLTSLIVKSPRMTIAQTNDVWSARIAS